MVREVYGFCDSDQGWVKWVVAIDDFLGRGDGWLQDWVF